jgi:glucose-6-phosphate 1-dehydrogenase
MNPQVQIALGARAKAPGEGFMGQPIELALTDDHPDEMTAYERLLGDAMDGENLLFAREDGVEKAWRVVDHVVYHHHKAYPYKPHTWGPHQSEGLIHDHDGWHDPVL